MANNKVHFADYCLITVFGKLHAVGFRKTSGDTNTLASRAAKLIRTPLTNGANKRYNGLVNHFVATGDEHGIARLESVDVHI
jgi:hypothetical protein